MGQWGESQRSHRTRDRRVRFGYRKGFTFAVLRGSRSAFWRGGRWEGPRGERWASMGCCAVMQNRMTGRINMGGLTEIPRLGDPRTQKPAIQHFEKQCSILCPPCRSDPLITFPRGDAPTSLKQPVLDACTENKGLRAREQRARRYLKPWGVCALRPLGPPASKGRPSTVRPLAPVVPSHTPEATSRSITPDCRGTCGAGRRCKPMETPECDGVRNGVSIIFYYSTMANIIIENRQLDQGLRVGSGQREGLAADRGPGGLRSRRRCAPSPAPRRR